MVARSMTGHHHSIREKVERTPAESIERSLVWMGRIVVIVSIVLVGTHVDGRALSSTALLMVVLYVGYVINYWDVLRSRRVEATVLTAIAIALAVFCLTTEVLQLGKGAGVGLFISASLAVFYLVAAS
ncbi:MAG: hypothetical protein OXS29_04800 [bacterium]|nr:hypothetical protein [bacterium]MDE0289204.1 hypothetical protein [bacterium]MDE0437425.1 hypothetical protein [bacterium]